MSGLDGDEDWEVLYLTRIQDASVIINFRRIGNYSLGMIACAVN